MGRAAGGDAGPPPERRQHPHPRAVPASLGESPAGGAVLCAGGIRRAPRDRDADGLRPRAGQSAHPLLLSRLGAGPQRAAAAGGARRTGADPRRKDSLMATSTKPVRGGEGESADRAAAAVHLGYLRQMLLIRRFEEKAGEAYGLGKIGGFCPPYIGQEAVAVGAIAALRPDDYITPAYRDHGQALAGGIPARAVMAEVFGKAG